MRSASCRWLNPARIRRRPDRSRHRQLMRGHRLATARHGDGSSTGSSLRNRVQRSLASTADIVGCPELDQMTIVATNHFPRIHRR